MELATIICALSPKTASIAGTYAVSTFIRSAIMPCTPLIFPSSFPDSSRTTCTPELTPSKRFSRSSRVSRRDSLRLFNCCRLFIPSPTLWISEFKTLICSLVPTRDCSRPSILPNTMFLCSVRLRLSNSIRSRSEDTSS